MQPDVSVVIVNWNTREILRNCLASVQGETKRVRLEVIVVDNASSDGSAELVQRDFPEARLIANSENRGFAAGNNQGIAASKGRYVLLLNSDTIVLDGAIDETVAFADAHPQAAAVGCRVLNPDRTLQPTCFMYPSVGNMVLSSTHLYRLFPRSRLLGRERMTWWERDDVREVDVVTGCFMLVRREAIDQVGGMDEDYFMFGEETDWCWRFRRAGWRLLFTPAGQIIHLGGQSTAKVRPQMTLQLRSGILLFFRKHRPWPVYAGACLLMALWFGLRAPFWAVRAMLKGPRAQECALLARTYAHGCWRSLRGWRALSCRLPTRHGAAES